MKKAPAKKSNDELRSEYDLSELKGGVRGKYYQEATDAPKGGLDKRETSYERKKPAGKKRRAA